MDELQKIIDKLEPDKALAAITIVADKLLGQVSEQDRLDFVVSLIGEAGTDKVASMVNL